MGLLDDWPPSRILAKEEILDELRELSRLRRLAEYDLTVTTEYIKRKVEQPHVPWQKEGF